MVGRGDITEITANFLDRGAIALVGARVDGEARGAELAIDERVGDTGLGVYIAPTEKGTIGLRVHFETLFIIVLSILRIYIPAEVGGCTVVSIGTGSSSGAKCCAFCSKRPIFFHHAS